MDTALCSNLDTTVIFLYLSSDIPGLRQTQEGRANIEDRYGRLDSVSDVKWAHIYAYMYMHTKTTDYLDVNRTKHCCSNCCGSG